VQSRNTQHANDDTDGTPAVLPAPLEKIVNTLVKDALKLEVAGINDMIPVAHIRRAAYWLHLTPDGKRKTLIIENAERMKDEARNSLLKTIEEPPPSAQIILCTAKPGSLLPTILSRLRPYQFFTRKPETEAEIIRRVFRDPEAAAAALDAGCAAAEENGAAHKNTAVSLVSNYLDGFLPVPKDSLPPLAALFAQTLAAAVSADPPAAGLVSSALAELRERGKERCEKAGLDTGKNSYAEVCAFIIEKCEKFQTRRLYGDFIAALQQFVFEATMGKSGVVSPGTLRLCELFRSKGAYSVSAVTVYNQNALYALEKLFLDLKESICRL
jgi:DNA polymerase-3 subunit gamma/tau